MLLAPSIIAGNLINLEAEVLSLNNEKADIIHFDIMDGNFVPNITFGFDAIKLLRKLSNAIFDVHLMINNSQNYLDNFLEAGCDHIHIHFESEKFLYKCYDKIKKFSKDVKFGVVINPSTNISSVKSILEFADFLTIMSVEPGFCAQSFIPSTFKKIEEANCFKDNLNFKTIVDGGINLDNIKKLKDLNVDICVIGSSFFKFKNHKLAFLEFQKAIYG